MKITFLGATQTVTGSKFLVELSGSRILVDCGLFQGLKELRLKNWRPFPVDPASLDAILLTHAHIDHSGYLPVLFKRGFKGPVYCTPGTRDLCEILLPDAGYLQEEEARFANKYGYSKHRPALPLYTLEDAKECLKSFQTVEFHSFLSLGEELKAQWTPVGHILGAACVHLQHQNRTLVFSGDVGRPDDILMNPPQAIQRADFLVVESTYGNRRHDPGNPWELLGGIIKETYDRGGIVLIPSFAVGRAQHILKLVGDLKASGKIPDLPVYLNSPMAIRATEVFCDHLADHRLDEKACRELCQVAKFVTSVEESKALTHKQEPAVIISSSGMAT
ncbi:MAG: MBL fold metallo-hydrolase, partial [bacterium]|nr:MBL fold metallo-hydrolase [bacterium]